MPNSPAFLHFLLLLGIRFLFQFDEVGSVSASTIDGHGRLCSPSTSFGKEGGKEEGRKKKGVKVEEDWGALK
jgi:hypothetical protein